MGSRHTPLTERRALIEDWRRSGLSVRAWATPRGIVPATFHRWLREMRPSPVVLAAPSGAARRDRGGFVEVVVPPPASVPPLHRSTPPFIVQVDQRHFGFTEPPPEVWFAAILRELRPC
jgi:hypothetical protein